MSEPEFEPKITVGIGDPSSPLYGQLLSEEDEKRLDAAGCEIVHGHPWSQSKTGLWLVVFVSKREPKADRPMLGGGRCLVPAKLCSGVGGYPWITIGTFFGTPKMAVAGHGLSLELPSDLARDALKRQYVVEWLVATVYEALEGERVNLKADEQTLKDLAVWVSTVADEAIHKAGL